MAKKKILVIADTPTVPTGFATVIKNVFANIPKSWDIHILGVNYHGDPHPLQSEYTLYPPSIGGDVYGFGRIPELLQRVKPDLIFILNDVWLCAEYILRIRKLGYNGALVIYTPVDSPAIKPDYVLPLNNASHVITYTDWALTELRNAGLTAPASVIPHGIDLTYFTAVDKMVARKELFKGIGFNYEDAFIVTYSARNQPRKRVDLFPYIFRQWIDKYPHDNVYMHYHGAAKGDLGSDIEYISHYFGVDNRLILTSKDLSTSNPLPIERLKFVYSAADVYLQICAVEGWGLPLHESMACKTAAIVPQYSAMQDWCSGGAYFVDVDPMPWFNPNNIDTMHKFIDISSAVEALEFMYQNKDARNEWAQKAYDHARQPKYMWKDIGKKFNSVFESTLNASYAMDQELWKKLQAQLKI